jgi:drug/metabolite transporter (DMT)-like permease
MDFRNKTFQFFVLLVLGLTWGSSFILMKIGLQAFTAFEVARWRMVFGAAILLPFLLQHWSKISKKTWGWLLAAGFIGSGIPAVLFAAGITRIDSSLAAIINSTAPLFTLLVGLTFFQLKVSWKGALGILIGLAGTVFLIASQRKIQADSSTLYFALMPLMGSICYGFSTNIIKSKLGQQPAMVISGGALFVVGFPALISLGLDGSVALVFSDPNRQEALYFIALLGFVGTGLAVLVFNYLIKQTTVLFAASVTYLIPVFALIWGWILNEDLNTSVFIGMGIIFFGVFLVNLKKKK